MACGARSCKRTTWPKRAPSPCANAPLVCVTASNPPSSVVNALLTAVNRPASPAIAGIVDAYVRSVSPYRFGIVGHVELPSAMNTTRTVMVEM